MGTAGAIPEVVSAQPRLRSFAFVAREDAEILIVGSMPGAASLAAGQYYAHPRNAFWPIMTALLRIDTSAGYQQRLEGLRAARIALWDVLHSCRREGSLDASIEQDTQLPNDFDAFFREHRRIRCVLFNGAKAEHAYRRHVASEEGGDARQYLRLPSTSPANASWSFGRKLAASHEALRQGRAGA